MKKAVNLIFPHQLFYKSPLLENGYETYLIEEFLFFKQYKFHKQKIALHRATMRYYYNFLKEQGIKVNYIDSSHELSDIRKFNKEIKDKSITSIHIINPTDYLLEKRVREMATDSNLKVYENPQFLNTQEELSPFFREDKKSFFQTTFYKQQRKKLNILLDENGEPEGGKWTYDKENRKKYPKSKTPPSINYPDKSQFWDEAVAYTNKYFKDNYGKVNKERLYPITHKETNEWLEQFFTYRFHDFGAYEDAILKKHSILNHSVLSPLINIGLILPKEVLDKSITYAEKENIPINSTEGFVRQIIGWREFIRGMYVCKGNFSRTRNFWKFNRKIPKCFYDGTTGIEPLDDTIKKVLKTGYCHHIERLMVLGNFMLLCEFDPDEVYKWFMELFIDAYDWVMVPNVYGMCMFADGGTFATKPYIGGSNYIKKMSNYSKGSWEETWDGLFWQFIANRKDYFSSNHRTGVLVHSYNKMSEEKRKKLKKDAETFIDSKLSN